MTEPSTGPHTFTGHHACILVWALPGTGSVDRFHDVRAPMGAPPEAS